VTNILFEAILEINQNFPKSEKDNRPIITVPEQLRKYMTGGKPEIVPKADLAYWYAGRFARKRGPGSGGVENNRGNGLHAFYTRFLPGIFFTPKF